MANDQCLQSGPWQKRRSTRVWKISTHRLDWEKPTLGEADVGRSQHWEKPTLREATLLPKNFNVLIKVSSRFDDVVSSRENHWLCRTVRSMRPVHVCR